MNPAPKKEGAEQDHAKIRVHSLKMEDVKALWDSAEEELAIPTFQTVLKAIALADGKLPGSADYLTKRQMIALAKSVLRLRKS